MTAQPISHAATVLLLQESAGELQVLMTKRAAGLSFMAGLWVFPGGRMEPGDLAPELVDRSDRTALAATCSRMLDRDRGTPIEAGTAHGLLVAACRETFEESGVLLAQPLAADVRWDEARVARVANRRKAASVEPKEFARLLLDEDLLLDLDHLVYWAHWITPAFETRRFDTRFFALRVPHGQEASVDHGELTHHAWLSERDVARHLASGEMKLAPPTQLTLQDLWTSHRRHGGLDAMLRAERVRVVPPILPKSILLDDEMAEIVLPWDAGYAAMPAAGCAVLASYPDYMLALPSRAQFLRRR
jgi:8-oxo-dGTP pyrophosphatase MutT (NUDIX family)